MTSDLWERGTLLNEDGQIAYWSQGTGPLMIFLHGGPGDDHQSLTNLADHFTSTHRCILFDQRGSGDSILDKPLSPENLTIEKFLEDISDLRKLFQQDQIILVGHSWGALLGLMYSIQFPTEVSDLVLIGIGPLSSSMEDRAHLNLEKRLTEEDMATQTKWKVTRRQAAHEGNRILERQAHLELVRILTKAWFLEQSVRDEFVHFYSENCTHNRKVSQVIWAQYQSFYLEKDLKDWTSRALCLYGMQDFEPIEQAQLLSRFNPNCQTVIVENAAHLPWIEQPRKTFDSIRIFLSHSA